MAGSSPVYSTMNIEEILWDEVRVTCEQDPSKNLMLYKVRVTFKSSPKSLTVSYREGDLLQSLLYTRPELVELTPYAASFKAFWWSSRIDSVDYDELIPLTVECQF